MDVELEIRRRIRQRGRITFAEFMELALFWPDGGYYSNPDQVWPSGDYYTSPRAHPAFGALLSIQVFQMWQLLDCPTSFYLVEMGAGSGLLCHDLIEYSAHLPQGFRDSLRYLCLDRPPLHGVEKLLPVEAGRKVQRLAAQSIPLHGIKGCILSNELVDSFPVHRVTVQGGALKETYVALEDQTLVEVLDSPSTSALEERLDSLDLRLLEGFSTEINLEMAPWLENVSSVLEQGFLLTIDYGHPASELYSQRRNRGTLTCFYRHTQTDNPYLRIGGQDITAKVDFTSLIELGRYSKMEPLGFNTQREFLQNLGLRRFIDQLQSKGQKQREVWANRLAMLDLVRQGSFGEFKVLAQGKGVGNRSLWGFEPCPGNEAMLNDLPVPLLTTRHMPLLEGRYPHLAVDWEELWS